MNCASCELTFSRDRTPLVLPCGHTFCCQCISLHEQSACLNCHKKGKPALNFAIYQHIVKKNTCNIDKYIKICLFGNMDVGKSSLLKRLISDQFEYKMNPTIGIDFKFIDKQIDGKIYRFQIWDSAGQQRYRAVSSNHLRGSDIVLLVYDLSMDPTQNGLGYWIKQINNYSQNANVILIGNKTDLKQSEIYMTADEQQIIKSKKWKHLKISCLSRQNIDKLWEVLIQKSKVAKGITAEQKMKSIFIQQSNSHLRNNQKSNNHQTKAQNKRCCR